MIREPLTKVQTCHLPEPITHFSHGPPASSICPCPFPLTLPRGQVGITRAQAETLSSWRCPSCAPAPPPPRKRARASAGNGAGSGSGSGSGSGAGSGVGAKAGGKASSAGAADDEEPGEDEAGGARSKRGQAPHRGERMEEEAKAHEERDGEKGAASSEGEEGEGESEAAPAPPVIIRITCKDWPAWAEPPTAEARKKVCVGLVDLILQDEVR